jgi:hypothetical protein
MSATTATALFEHAISEIESTYVSLGHTLGWRFLCVSKDVLQAKPEIALITANPGGNEIPTDHPTASCENGCAYLAETWGTAKRGQHKLQKQIQHLFDALAVKTQFKMGGTALMERSLIAYYIPFRSPRLGLLPRKKESLKFARSLWAPLFTRLRPKLVITIDRDAYRYFGELIDSSMTTPSRQREMMPTGWGACTADVTHYGEGKETATLVRLPHLSTFQLFSRAECKPFVDAILTSACKHLQPTHAHGPSPARVRASSCR